MNQLKKTKLNKTKQQQPKKKQDKNGENSVKVQWFYEHVQCF